MWWQTLRDDNPDKQKIKELEEKCDTQIMNWLVRQCNIPTNRDIKPCPFCGYDAVLEPILVRKGWEAIIYCNGCLASVHTITYDTEDEAVKTVINVWNQRV